MPARRVLVVDEGRSDPIVAGIAALLQEAGFTVRVAVADDTAGEVVAHYRPDVAVVSLVDGVGSAASEAGGHWLQRDHGVPVVLVEPPARADHAGPRVASVLAGDGSPGLRAGDVAMDEASRLAHRAGHPLDLTRLEFDLLAHFVRNRNRVLTRSALLSSVWHNEPVTPNAIEALVSKLRAKLDDHGPRVIHTVRGVGYVLRVPAPPPFELVRPNRRRPARHC